jgi:aryl-alcohol dehydrogenase-like predicted oxidoreductase
MRFVEVNGARISAIGLGTWQFGSKDWAYGDEYADKEAGAILTRALDLGVNLVDTAEVYGRGNSETIVGRTIAARRDDVFLATKWMPVIPLASQVEKHGRKSAERLGVDTIDLYQIHWPNPDQDIEEGWAAMATLKERGLVRHIGVSNFDVSQLRRIQSIAPVETLQPPYSLIDRAAEKEVLPFAGREGIGVIVYSPMGSGLLTGGITRERIAAMPDDDWRKTDPRFTEPELSRHLALATRLRAVADRYDVTPGAVAVAWTLRNPAVDGAITGFRRPDQVDPILTAASLELTEQDLAEINDVK